MTPTEVWVDSDLPDPKNRELTYWLQIIDKDTNSIIKEFLVNGIVSEDGKQIRVQQNIDIQMFLNSIDTSKIVITFIPAGIVEEMKKLSSEIN